MFFTHHYASRLRLIYHIYMYIYGHNARWKLFNIYIFIRNYL